jgi:thiol:disulfide interchange protein
MTVRCLTLDGWLVVTCCSLAAAGCGPGQPATDTVATENRPSPPEANKVENGGPVTLHIADWTEIQSAVAAHRGKPVVLDLWATW